MRTTKGRARRALLAATCVAACTHEPRPLDAELAGSSAALSGREGKLEYAIDAPWRLEPVGYTGHYEHGAIPITISVHDAHQASSDGNYNSVGDFLSLEITEKSPHGTSTGSVSFDELREVEATFGAWQMTGRPEHALCEPVTEVCTHVKSLAGTSAWHATYWYTPQTGGKAGDDVELTVEVRLRAGLTLPDPKAEDDDPYPYITGQGTLRLKDHLKVHLGEKPLPRFGGGWLYGDLHYHSQNTDNEGEAGYAYRGTLRAMGSLGLDFAFATEHASNSKQITDIDVDFHPKEKDALRDMSPERFRFGLDILHGERAANQAVLENAGAQPLQSVRGRSVAPQLYLGGEVDAIPEVSGSEIGNVSYGNDLNTDIADFCTNSLTCDARENVRQSPYGGYGVVGWAGFQEEFTRQHIVYMPREAGDREAFVGSNTQEYGGGGRWFPDVLRDIEAHGYAFLAHPLIGPDTSFTHPGPDMFPYSDLQLSRAFQSPAILGLQLWNEDPRLKTTIGEGDSRNTGKFNRSASSLGGETGTPKGTCKVLEDEQLECLLELIPQWKKDGFQWQHSGSPTYAAEDKSFAMARDGRGMYSDLHQGTYVLDEQLQHGLNPARTASLSWLPEGEPRRVFMAAGSDAHGDLNYRREGYFFGTSEVTSTAIGTPRNLVYAGGVRFLPPRVDDAPDRVLENAPPKKSGSVPAKGDVLAELELSKDSSKANPKSEGVLAGTIKSKDVTASTIAAARVSADKLAPVGDTVSPGETGSAGKGGVATVPGFELPPGADQVYDPSRPRATVRYPQSQVVDALKSGNFSVTDGPALRIVIDRNRNGEIDESDVPMGGILHLYDGQETLPLLIEWQSTPEFGPVANVDLYLGSVRGAAARTYAPLNHGVRTAKDPQSTLRQEYRHWDGQVHAKMQDNYFRDPTGQLRIQLPTGNGTRSYAGVHAVDLDLRRFPASISEHEGGGTGFYLRAFAKTEPEKWAQCKGDSREYYHRSGQCLERLAYTNPVWAVRRENPLGCPADERALDHDGDQEPDHCDACPGVAGPNCVYEGGEDTDDWSRRFGGPSFDEAQAVATDDQGNVFVAGHFQGTVPHGTITYTSEGAYDGYLAKYTAAGSLSWIKHFGGTGDMRILAIDVDSHGNPVVTGWFNGDIAIDDQHRYTARGDDVFVANIYGRHYQNVPNLRWAKVLAGDGRTTGLAVSVDDSGHTWVGGGFEGSIASGTGGIPQGGGGSDCYAMRLDDLGRHDLTVPIKGAGNCEVTGLATDGNDLLIAGRYTGEVSLYLGAQAGIHTSQTGWNGFVARYREGRFYDWSAFVGDNTPGCASADAQITDLAFDAESGLYAVGFASGCLGVRGPDSELLASSLTTTQPFVVRLAGNGQVYSGFGLSAPGLDATTNRYAYDVAVDEDGGYVITGAVATTTQAPGKLVKIPHKGWVARYTPQSTQLWTETFGESAQNAGLACDIDGEGYVALAGRFASSFSIGDATPVTDAGGGDAFVAVLAP